MNKTPGSPLNYSARIRLWLVVAALLITAGICALRVIFHSGHHWFGGPNKQLYTSAGTVQDTQGNSYPTITIGDREWMATNLNTTVFRDGTPIPQARTYAEWRKAWDDDQPVWAWIDMDEQKGNRYGRFYNWYAVTDPRGLAPEGWELPDSAAWMSLIRSANVDAIICYGKEATDDHYLNGAFDALVLQSPIEPWHNKDWMDPDWSENTGTNEAGFNALPGGMIDYQPKTEDSEERIYSRANGMWGAWWGRDGMYMIVGDHAHESEHDYVAFYKKQNGIFGMNVRCVRSANR